jgi:hypothetical protein
LKLKYFATWPRYQTRCRPTLSPFKRSRAIRTGLPSKKVEITGLVIAGLEALEGLESSHQRYATPRDDTFFNGRFPERQ